MLTRAPEKCPMWVLLHFLCIFGNGLLQIQSDIQCVFQKARFTEDEGGRCLCRSGYIGKPLRQPGIPCFQLKLDEKESKRNDSKVNLNKMKARALENLCCNLAFIFFWDEMKRENNFQISYGELDQKKVEVCSWKTSGTTPVILISRITNHVKVKVKKSKGR